MACSLAMKLYLLSICTWIIQIETREQPCTHPSESEYWRGAYLFTSLTLRGFRTCFILASSLRVCSSFLRSFLFPTRMMGTLGQKCFTSGVHFSGMFSVPREKKKKKKRRRVEILETARERRRRRRGTIKRDRQCRVTVQNTSHDGLLCRLLEAKMFLAALIRLPIKSIKPFKKQLAELIWTALILWGQTRLYRGRNDVFYIML